MIEDLRWMRFGGRMVLEAYDGHTWFPIKEGAGPWVNEVPYFDKDGIVSHEVYHKQVYGDKPTEPKVDD